MSTNREIFLAMAIFTIEKEILAGADASSICNLLLDESSHGYSYLDFCKQILLESDEPKKTASILKIVKK